MMIPYSVYLHIPFCTHRCGYCDFNTYAGLENLIPDYITAVCSEIDCFARAAEQRLPAHSIFFGGGTPSLIPPSAVERMLITLQDAFALIPNLEISLEANPGTLSREHLRTLHKLGINRLSLGMQSTNPQELRLLERQHDFVDVIQAVKWARWAGFDNLNLDLMFGLPGQSLASWQNSLRLALDLQPEHFALYALTLEEGTPFGRWAARGLLPTPDPDLAAEMYEWASDELFKYGYAQYEISNWAQTNSEQSPLSPTQNPGFACRHNLQYWRNLPYVGFGAGAHGYVAGMRTVNANSPPTYIRRLQRQTSASTAFPHTPATITAQPVDRQAEIAETMMMGLRLTREGVSNLTCTQRFEQNLLDLFEKPIERLVHLGLLEWAGESQEVLRLTQAGRLLGNQVFMEFLEPAV